MEKQSMNQTSTEQEVNIISTVKDTQVQNTLNAISNFQTIIKKQFKDNYHYGIIPGTQKKPTLLKPGAEVIITLLGLSTHYEILASTRDFEKEFFDYVIRCVLSKDGKPIAEGLGSANTLETKFIREEGKGAGQDNNVLKMAKKRALVDAALNVGSLSDVFTQDFDDLDLKDLNGNKASKNSEEYKLERPITAAQAKRMFAMSNGDYGTVKEILKKYNYEQSTDVKVADYETICSEIEKVVADKNKK